MSASKTGIEWTDATWNPTTGCTKVSRGCDHCYAETLSRRLLKKQYTKRLPVVDTPVNRGDPFAVRLWPERLEQPRDWQEPRQIFVNSMSDLFHSEIPDVFVRRIFEVMLEVDRHIYQVLTKRPSRALRFWRANKDLFGGEMLPAHIWIGTSVEDARAQYRIRQLEQVPAMIRFLSCEPLLGPLNLDLSGVSWVIVGGESGPNHRPMDLAWARGIRDQCLLQAVPFFFKQVGGRTPKAGGRKLDGEFFDAMPQALNC